MPYNVRNFRESDVEDCVALYNAAETSDPDFVPLTEVEYRMRTLSAKTHGNGGHFVAIDGGSVVGEAMGTYEPGNTGPMAKVAHFEIHLAPRLVGTAVEGELYGKLVSRLKSLGASRIGTRVDTRHTARLEQLQRLGFARNDYENHGMERPTSGAAEPDIPEGYTVRTARIPEEIETMHSVVEESFATRGKMSLPLERFARQWGPNCDQDLTGTFLAERAPKGGIVGAVVSLTHRKHNELHGTRRGGSYCLAVIPSERKKGLATALLLKSIEWLGEQGMDTAYLSVNVANPDALNIYIRAGYRTVQIYHGYSVKIV
ncbi:MAG: GNAT family N-acetyltransferase [Methanobacteriota archaeon]